MDEIAKCPNCGGKTYLNAGASYAGWLGVQCKRCYMHIGFPSPDPDNGPEAVIEWFNRIATAVARAEAAEKRLHDDLKFVERWANHHAPKRRETGELVHTAEEILSVIQHYPPILEITRSYIDGVVPDTNDPFSERDALRAENERLRELISANNLRTLADCENFPSTCAEHPGPCENCPRRYMIDLPADPAKAQGGGE